MIYMFIAEGFEEIEALCPLDIMRRAGIEVTTVGIGRKEITGAHGITVRTDICSREYSRVKDFDMIFLPGGMPGTLNLANSIVSTFANRVTRSTSFMMIGAIFAYSVPHAAPS